MDDELRKAFATLSAQIATVSSDVAVGTALQKETIYEVKHLSGRVERLEASVFGSKPPPPMPVMKRITLNEGEMAELAGQVIAVKADIAGMREEMKTNTDATLAIKKEIVDGVKSFWKRHPKLETALAALILAGIGVLYALITHGGQLP